MLEHSTEALRQEEGTRLNSDGWVGVDAWCRSVGSCVELCIRLNVNSAFIIKKIYFFPMQVFYRALEARHGKTQLGIG